MRVLPGDPLAAISGEGGGSYVLSQEQLQAARVSLRLDRPYAIQYLDWLKDILRGDLGKSFWRGEPIRELIFRRGPITGQIAVMAGDPLLDHRPARGSRGGAVAKTLGPTTSSDSSSCSSWPSRASGLGLMIVLSLVLALHVATAPDHRVPVGRPDPKFCR